MKKCSVENCRRYAVQGGMCWAHFKRASLGIPFDVKNLVGYRPRVNQKASGTTCSVAGCNLQVRSLGLCEKHYQRKRNSGTTEEPENFFTDTDEWSVWAKKKGRVSIESRKKLADLSEWDRWVQTRVGSQTFMNRKPRPKKERRKIIDWHEWAVVQVMKTTNARLRAEADEWTRWSEKVAGRYGAGCRRGENNVTAIEVTCRIAGVQMCFKWEGVDSGDGSS